MVAAQPHAERSASRRCLGQCVCARCPTILLHPALPDERPWKFLLPVLALAFAARAAKALSGDFVLHPDEIMQYLEPAHRLVFGNGVIYWEYFYGARSWLVPGLVAGVLKLFDIVGLGQPFLVRRRRQARVLRDFPAHPGEHVLFCPVAFWRDCGAGCVADGCFLVRTGRFCSQADDRVCRHGPADVCCSRSVCGLRRTD